MPNFFIFCSSVLHLQYSVFYGACQPLRLSDKEKITKYERAQYNTVPAENLKIMLSDIGKQKPDHGHGYHKSRYHRRGQRRQLRTGKVQAEFQQLQQACAEHHRNCQKERKLRRHGTGNPDQQRSHNGGSGTGSSRKDSRQKLKRADKERRLKTQF